MRISLDISLCIAGLSALTNAAQVFEQQKSAPKAADTTDCYSNEFSVPAPLPGWQGTTEEWGCQYAGTLNSNSDGSHQLFFWFYRNTNANAPLTIWMNGGPGASSAFANFLLNGPNRITSTGDGDSQSYEINPAEEGSWTSVANMVYLDQPVGTGFSYSTADPPSSTYLTNMG